MPYIITAINPKGRPVFWQTKWASRERIVDRQGNATYDADGMPLFRQDAHGRPCYKEIGGWVPKQEYATLYADFTEACAVNSVRDLRGEVVEA